MDTIVRLTSLKISNIKNVEYGNIIMPNGFERKLDYNNAEVLGIYGQNGSGKTAVIDTLYYMQRIMTGESVDETFAEYINENADSAEIEADFNIFTDDIIYEAGYKLSLHKTQKRVEIWREALSFAKNAGELRSNKVVCIDYNRNKNEAVFTPKKRLNEVIEFDKESKTDLIVAKKIAEKSNCSYIFSELGRDIFCRDYDNDFRDCSQVIKALFRFALKDLFVIRNTHSGLISANFLLPMAFRVEHNDMGVKGEFTISLTEPTVVDEGRKQLLYKIVEQTNIVLNTIVPNMRIGIRDYGMQMTDSGNDGYKLELVSIRNNASQIPIRMESDGIIKIISILNVLIQAFSSASVCLAVDELDAGIFEYMLGELLDIFNKSAKGQLIFTSHNLRALEMLGRESVMFSTSNPANRYIHMKNIKASNNMRDVYLRGITLGGQDEEIYEETDSLKIARAFRKAGRGILK